MRSCLLKKLFLILQIPLTSQDFNGTLTEPHGLPDFLIPYCKAFSLFIELICTCPKQINNGERAIPSDTTKHPMNKDVTAFAKGREILTTFQEIEKTKIIPTTINIHSYKISNNKGLPCYVTQKISLKMPIQSATGLPAFLTSYITL